MQRPDDGSAPSSPPLSALGTLEASRLRSLEADVADFLFTLEVPEPPLLLVLSLQGSEGLNETFRFDLELISEDPDLPLETYVDQPGHLILRGREGDRHVVGRIEHLELLEIGRHHTRYRFRLVPALQTLRYRRTSRIFQNTSVPEIITQVIESAGLPRETVQARLHARYAPREYCVQYQEDDLSFLTRLCEEEGIAWFFDDLIDALERHQDVLVLTDGPHAIDRLPLQQPIPFSDESPSALLQEELIFRIGLSTGMHSGKVSLRDYNFQHPELSLEASDSGPRFAQLEDYRFPGPHQEVQAGQRLAKLRRELHSHAGQRLRGETNSRLFRAGYCFDLDLHPRSALNRGYLLVRIEHEGSQPQVLGLEAATGQVQPTTYSCRWQGVPDDQVYRPPRETPRPLVHGLQTAEVVGPAGQEIYCDEWGRVKVRFPWDRTAPGDESRSCWLRSSQPWAGTGFGGVFLPRVGQEVLVQFLEGDPDRPLIVGRVYNGDNPLPYPLPEHASRSTLQTRSTPGGGGYNELRFEDRAGQEEVFLRAQRDHNVTVLRDQVSRIGQDQHLQVARDRQRHVLQDEQVQIGRHRQTRIDGNEVLLVGENREEQVEGSHHRQIGRAEHIEVLQGNRRIDVYGQSQPGDSEDHDQAGDGASGEAGGADGAECSDGGDRADHILVVHNGDCHTHVVSGGSALKVQHNIDTTVMEGNYALSVLGLGDHVTSLAGGNMQIQLEPLEAGGNFVLNAGQNIDQSANNNLRAHAGQDQHISAGKSLHLHAGTVVISADVQLQLVVGSSKIVLTTTGVTVTGTNLSSKAVGMHEIGGAMVKIN